ncbi:hypothetical protein B0H19DRAFT_1079011 [Mycena capillaripes]|nr:hypothetical protein B0H19DRAFT_1079011 [Mycena capillaripes]
MSVNSSAANPPARDAQSGWVISTRWRDHFYAKYFRKDGHPVELSTCIFRILFGAERLADAKKEVKGPTTAQWTIFLRRKSAFYAFKIFGRLSYLQSEHQSTLVVFAREISGRHAVSASSLFLLLRTTQNGETGGVSCRPGVTLLKLLCTLRRDPPIVDFRWTSASTRRLDALITLPPLKPPRPRS